jgi:formamidopyrimidine-DNA glycosylase
MPELPEVEVIVRELRPKLTNETIQSVDVFWHRSLVNENGSSLPVNRSIQTITRRGKYIILNLDKNALVIHLRMTGQLIIKRAEPEETKHLRIKMRLRSGKNILFYDSRKFGRIYYLSDPSTILAKIGIDALDPSFTESTFHLLCENKKMRIKSFLLDQRFLAGLGNIYIDESLFRAGIHPETNMSHIALPKRSKLFHVICDVLKTAINHMGTTISDYKTTGGGFGTHQYYLSVYDKQNTPCPVCETSIKKIRIGGRGTHYCPTCQPATTGFE